uniref:Ig-like domain-containing protein n=1 Tax=Gouania willdenowi TaxID=441366 RepID=A0A8C5DVY4_GOUWI
MKRHQTNSPAGCVENGVCVPSPPSLRPRVRAKVADGSRQFHRSCVQTASSFRMPPSMRLVHHFCQQGFLLSFSRCSCISVRVLHPSGFQSSGAEYNCITCQYDSCEFPLDCPVETINVTEGSRSQIRCNETFNISEDVEVIWRFAEEIKTQQVDQFKEVTVGDDRLYSIPSTRLHHQGTYQCELYSAERSIVRLYFYLSVTPRVKVGRSQLQELFDRSLLPRGRFVPEPASAPSSALTLLLLICLTASLLLFLLSLG